MKRQCFLIAVLAIIGIGLFLVFSRPTQALTYQGKSIEHWFAQLPVAVIPPPGVRLGSARAVVTSYCNRAESLKRVKESL